MPHDSEHPEHLAQRVADLALERKALDVDVIDVRNRSSYTDFLVIATGTSDRHVQSIAESVDGTLSREGHPILGREGLREGQWALIDAGSVILHVFHPFTRESIDLERLWSKAPIRRAEPAPNPAVAQPQA